MPALNARRAILLPVSAPFHCALMAPAQHRLEPHLRAAKFGDLRFPLITNVVAMSALEVLLAYKQQPMIEKRFAQLKTDFVVAPVYLKEASRIQALLCVYFVVLLVEALLERELRRAMERSGDEDLPLYPESRPCRRPIRRYRSRQ